MTDIAAFLLARIAEDERGAWGTGETGYRIGVLVSDQIGTTVGGARLRKECEAKRKLVGLAQHIADGAWQDGELRAVSEFRSAKLLHLLAQPYADHEDFDPAWKVTA